MRIEKSDFNSTRFFSGATYIWRNKMIIIIMMNEDDDVGGNPPRKSSNGGTALLAHRIVGLTLPPVHKLSWGGLIDYDNCNDKDDNELGVKDVSDNDTMWWYSHLLVIHRPTDDRSQYRVGSVRSSQLRNPTIQPTWMPVSICSSFVKLSWTYLCCKPVILLLKMWEFFSF